ncbi:MAG: hypothetical protein HY232_04530 [Acidobacteria bacterium]|nr:hypothetical protein [Acidobacteriota bacterium]
MDIWAATSEINIMNPRDGHTAVWTGTKMLALGGNDVLTYLNTGGRYDPATNTWAAISMVGAPSARTDHTAV